ncbi:MAG: AgmX/PglI C-terminal domain-containing protein, partial [Pseudobdellovibrio sp.]
HIVERSGIVKLQNNEMPAEIQINSEYKFEALDVIRTENNSEAVIEFQGGGQFRLGEKTEVVLDVLDNGSPLVVIRTGEVFVEKFGKSPGFWIRSEGQLYSASDYVLLDRKNGTKLVDAMPTQEQEQISQVEIETVLNSKKNDFFKCFGQLIQKLPQASGQVLIAFTIEKQGATSKVEISKSDINDTHFKSCLIEVVLRTKFRSFSGNPIATVFPLKF